MKRRISARIICLLVAVTILVGALAVSAMNGSPYETLKNAIMNTMFAENVTIEAEFTVRLDGEVYQHATGIVMIGDDSVYSYNYAVGIGSHMMFETEDFVIGTAIMASSTGTQWYYVHMQRSPLFISAGHEMFGVESRDSNRVRLVELGADLLIGDLRNNLTMSSQDGVRHISGAIVESQLPEIMRLLIDWAVEEQYRWRSTNHAREDFSSVLLIPIRSLTVNRIYVDARVDSDGNLIYINAGAIATIVNMFDDTHQVELNGVIHFTDIGTTVPYNPFPGAEEIFTQELFAQHIMGTDIVDMDYFLEQFDSVEDRFWTNNWFRTMLYFTRDAYGNIDQDSITSTWWNR